MSLKAKNGEIMVVEDINFEKPKTKDFSSILKNLNINGKKVLMLTVNKMKMFTNPAGIFRKLTY